MAREAILIFLISTALAGTTLRVFANPVKGRDKIVGSYKREFRPRINHLPAPVPIEVTQSSIITGQMAPIYQQYLQHFDETKNSPYLRKWNMARKYVNANNEKGLSLMCRMIYERAHRIRNTKIRLSRFIPRAGLAIPGRSGYAPIEVVKCGKSNGEIFYLTKGRSENTGYFVKPVNSVSAIFELDEKFSHDV